MQERRSTETNEMHATAWAKVEMIEDTRTDARTFSARTTAVHLEAEAEESHNAAQNENVSLKQAASAPTPLSDAILLERLLAGDAAAFETLYDRRQASVYRFALRMSGSPTLAEDVTQDVFLALLRGEQQFDETRGTLANYLLGMTRHRVLQRLTRARTFVPLATDSEAEMAAFEQRWLAQRDHTLDVINGLMRAEQSAALREAILVLPPHYREVVLLCQLHEMSYEQAAEIIGCPIGTVRSRLNRARAMLLERLTLTHGGHIANQAGQAGPQEKRAKGANPS